MTSRADRWTAPEWLFGSDARWRVKEDLEPAPIRVAYLQHELDVVRRLHAGGVPFLAGTDAPAGILIPGVTLHLELERFVAAGFTPLEALQTATINPARFLNRTNDLGTVQKGKIADLVILNANPLADIRNTRSIDSVIADGRYYSRDRLNTILTSIEGAAKRH
jgi:imidazolonepropionase-like amidohydrolase